MNTCYYLTSGEGQTGCSYCMTQIPLNLRLRSRCVLPTRRLKQRCMGGSDAKILFFWSRFQGGAIDAGASRNQ
jgi:hypothetical protein